MEHVCRIKHKTIKMARKFYKERNFEVRDSMNFERMGFFALVYI